MPLLSYDTLGQIAAGRLKVEDHQGFLGAMRKFADGFVRVRVEVATPRRSLQANRWYWGQVLHLIAEHTGYEPEELHEYFKQRFIPKHVAIADRNGEVKDDRVIGGTTTRLSTTEFAEYCERIRQFAAEELNVDIPDPE